MNLILGTDRVSFDSKRQIMEYVFKKFPDFEVNNPDFFNDLERRIIPKRNIFAHYLLYMGQDAIDLDGEKIGLQKFKNQDTIIWYTIQELKDHIVLINKNIGIANRLIKR